MAQAKSKKRKPILDAAAHAEIVQLSRSIRKHQSRLKYRNAQVAYHYAHIEAYERAVIECGHHRPDRMFGVEPAPASEIAAPLSNDGPARLVELRRTERKLERELKARKSEVERMFARVNELKTRAKTCGHDVKLPRPAEPKPPRGFLEASSLSPAAERDPNARLRRLKPRAEGPPAPKRRPRLPKRN